MASRSIGVMRRIGQVLTSKLRVPARLPRPSPSSVRSPIIISNRSALFRSPRSIFQGPYLGLERNAARMGFCVDLAPLASGSQITFRSMNHVASNCLASVCDVVQEDNQIDITSLDQLETGPFLQKGCNGAVYAARLKNCITPRLHRLLQPDINDWPLVFKMVFNYYETLDVQTLFQAETVPYTVLPDHPSVAKTYGVFVAPVPSLPMAKEMFPTACPPGLYPELGENCFGKDQTLFIVMKRYSSSLSERLAAGALDTNEAIRVLLQLLEGDVLMKDHNIAHRDIHSRNILIDENETGRISACIADFGCSTDRLVRSRDAEFRNGSAPGAPNLQAPECTNPSGPLDYRKADLWSIASLAYNLFQPQSNPFMNNLDARCYRDGDLPAVPGAPSWLNRLVHQMLHREPRKRPSSAQCADILHLFSLQPPSSWLLGQTFPTSEELREWVLLRMAHLILTFRKDEDQRLHLYFFNRLNEERLRQALRWLRNAFKKSNASMKDNIVRHFDSELEMVATTIEE